MKLPEIMQNEDQTDSWNISKSLFIAGTERANEKYSKHIHGNNEYHHNQGGYKTHLIKSVS